MSERADTVELGRWYTTEFKIRFDLPCDCTYCVQQYRDDEAQKNECLTYVGDMEIADVTREAAARAKSIFQHHNLIRRLIYLHGDVIIKRWGKRSKNKRKDIILKVYPDVYLKGNMLIDLFPYLRRKTMTEQTTFRKAYLVQYLNLETLSEDPTRLIHLLHHRSIWYPKDWVPFDNAQIQLAWHQGRIDERRAEGSVMMTGHEYGTWRTFNRRDVHNGSAYGAPRALLILEAQELIMWFLHGVIVEILGDTLSAQNSISGMGSGTLDFAKFDESEGCRDWWKLVNTEVVLDSAQPWSSLISPFTAPPKFDIDVIVAIAENQTSEAQDELWLLQTEPEYFYESAKHLRDCYYDKMDGLSQNARVSLTKNDNIAYIMTIGVFRRAQDWQWALEQCQIVQQEQKTHVSQPHIGTQISESYERALGCSRLLLSRIWRDYKTDLGKAVVKSDAFGSSYRTIQTGLYDNAFATKGDVKEYSTLWDRDRIGWCVYWLTRDREDYRTFPAISVLQYLEQYLSSCPVEESKKLDSEMRLYISNLAAVDRMFAVLDLHRPTFKAPESVFDINEDRQVWKVLQRLNSPIKTKISSDLGLGSSCFPLDKFRMPKGKKDAEWLAKSDGAQKALAKLWKRACREYEKLLEENHVPRAYIDPQLRYMRHCESPEFLSRVEEERNRILSRLNAARERKLADIVNIQTVSGSHGLTPMDKTNKKHEIQVPLRSKVKTRPDVPLEAEIASGTTHCEQLAQQQPQILYELKHKSTAQRVVSRMFPSFDFDASQPMGTLDWQDFVTALVKLGFGVDHGGGSAFTFEGDILLPAMPAKLERRSIVIHRPHPKDTMSPVRLQGIGTRLHRNFGWERANFAFTNSHEFCFTNTEIALKVQSNNTPEHQSWLDPSTAHFDILLSFRTPTDRTAFNHNSAVTIVYVSLTTTFGFTITRKLNIDNTPELADSGLQGNTVEVVQFHFAPSTIGSEKRALFETRLHAYLDLMMDHRRSRSNAGYGAHLLGPLGKLSVLFMSESKKRGGENLSENRLINWTGGWSVDHDDGREDDQTAFGTSYVLILGWQGEEEAKPNLSFLDRLPRKGLRKKNGMLKDAKKKWGKGIGRGEKVRTLLSGCFV